MYFAPLNRAVKLEAIADEVGAKVKIRRTRIAGVTLECNGVHMADAGITFERDLLRIGA